MLHLPVLLAAAALALPLSSVEAAAAPKRRPNIVIALADDLGWNDLQGFGQGNRMQSPQLAALAADGIRLNSWYTFKFCSPSRSQMLLGRYAYHLGQQTELNLNPQTGCENDSTQGRNKAFMCSIKCGVPLQYKMLPVLLKQQGFSTHMLGKWHQGFYKKEYTPTWRGFDTYFGSYTNNDHFTHVDPYGRQPKSCPWWTPASNKTCPRPPDDTCLLWDLTNNSGTTIRNAPTALNGTYTARLYGAEGSRLIRAHDAGLAHAQPFFLYAAFTVVHSPIESPPESIARYDPATVPSAVRRVFGGMVVELDSAVGQIADALKATGMWDNSLLWFSTDNGSPLNNGGNNAPLRGSKMTDWEGGVRGLGFVSGGLVPASRRNMSWDGLASQVDLYATLAARAGVSAALLSASGPVAPDSLDLWPALLAGGASPRTELVHNINGNWSGALRVGDFKLLLGDPNEAGRGSSNWSTLTPWAMEDAHPKHLCETAHCPCVARPCLFQVGAGVDPEERHDLADAQPEKLKELLARFAELQRTEVTVEASGLCPQSPGINKGGWPDASQPDGCTANSAGGHWQPWM